MAPILNMIRGMLSSTCTRTLYKGQVRSFVKKPLFFMGLQVLWAVFYGSGDDQNHFFESQTPLDDKAAPHRSRPIMSR
jgi:hypothetical protein